MPINRRFLVNALSSVLIATMATLWITGLKRLTGHAFITTRLRKASLAKLVDLPLEVLVEILSLLEWKDILRTRQTSRRLRDASLARPIWLSLVQLYSAIQPRPFLPEKPLDLYTDRELEYLVLKWQSGNAGRTLSQPKELRLSIPETYLLSVHLVEGGRWLLFGARDGSIKYHDLNSPGETSQAVTLVPTHFDQNANTIVLLSVDMDPDVEYTTFNLGIMSHRVKTLGHDPEYPNPPRYARWIEVCRVTSYWDENGRVQGLRAERLACFREEFLCGCDSFTLGGRYVAYSVFSYAQKPTQGDGQNIAVVDWTVADSTSLTYPRRLIWRHRAKWLALLPDDRLLCHNIREILLFDLNDAHLTVLLPTQRNQPPQQPAVARTRLFVDAISQPYLVHDSIRFAILTEEGVKGLIIPRSTSVTHSMDCIDLLSDSIISYYARVGYHRAVVCSPEPSMLQYAWPEEPSSSLVPQKRPIHTQYGTRILFDEHSSRLISCGTGSRIEAILNLAAL